MTTNIKSNNTSIWLQAIRPFSFTATAIPVFVGSALALSHNAPVSWGLLPLVFLAALLLHTGTNLISDYFDFMNNVDKDYTFGSSHVLVEKLMKPKEIFIGACISFMLACMLGLFLIMVRGLPILLLGLTGIIGGYFYTGKPFGYKYFALGDFFVFILMGPLMVIGAYYTLTGDYNNSILLTSLPIGFLVTAILYANNIRDIAHDKEAKVRTIANILGHKRAKIGYYILLSFAYLSLLILLFSYKSSFWLLLAFLSLPVAIKNIKAVRSSTKDSPESLSFIDQETAKLHLVFGMLFFISIIITKLTS